MPTLDMGDFLRAGRASSRSLDQLIDARARSANSAGRSGLVVSPADDRPRDRHRARIPATSTGQFDQTRPSARRCAGENLTEAQLRDDIATRADAAPAARARSQLGCACPRASPGLCRAAARAAQRHDRRGAGRRDRRRASTRPTPRSRAFYQQQPRPLHHPRAAGDQICADRPRAGRASGRRDRGGDRAPSTATTPPPIGPRETRTLQSGRAAGPRRPTPAPSRSACAAAPPSPQAAAQAGLRRRRRHASPTRRQRAFADQRPAPRSPPPAFARRAGRGRRPGPVDARLARRPGRAINVGRPAARGGARRDRRRRSSAASAPTRSTALVTRLEEQIDDGASFEEVAARRAAHHRHHAADHRAGPAGRRPAWQAPAELRPCCASAFEHDAGRSEPGGRASRTNARFALLGVDRVEPAAPPPLAEIRDRVRADLIRAARARPAPARLANAIAARINGGTPPAQAFAEARPAPAAAAADRRCAGATSAAPGQPGAAAAARPVQPAAGHGRAARGARRRAAGSSSSRQQSVPRRRRARTPQLVASVRGPSSRRQRRRGNRRSNSPRAMEPASTSSATTAAIRPSASAIAGSADRRRAMSDGGDDPRHRQL